MFGRTYEGPRKLKYFKEGSSLKNKSWYWAHEDLPIEWSFTCDFPWNYKETVRDSFDYWDGMVERQLFVENPKCVWDEEMAWPAWKNHVVVSWRDHRNARNPRTRGTAYRDTHYDNLYRMYSGKIVYWKPWFKYGQAQRRTTARHEVGHILGFHHIVYKDCIMFRYSESNQPTKKACDVEIKELRRLYGQVPVR